MHQALLHHHLRNRRVQLPVGAHHVPRAAHHHLQQRVHHQHETRVRAAAAHHHAWEPAHKPKAHPIIIIVIILILILILILVTAYITLAQTPHCPRVVALLCDELAARRLDAWVLLQVPLGQRVNVGVDQVDLQARHASRTMDVQVHVG